MGFIKVIVCFIIIGLLGWAGIKVFKKLSKPINQSKVSSIPKLKIQFINRNKDEITIYNIINFSLSDPWDSIPRTQLATGQIKLCHIKESKEQEITIPGNGKIEIFAEFINQSQYFALLERGNAILNIDFREAENNRTIKPKITFSETVLSDIYITIIFYLPQKELPT